MRLTCYHYTIGAGADGGFALTHLRFRFVLAHGRLCASAVRLERLETR